MKLRQKLFPAILLTLFIITGCDNSSTGPGEDEGIIPSENLEAANRYSFEYEDGSPKGRALIVWHNGEILLEDYQRFPDNQTFDIYAPDVYFKDPLNEFRRPTTSHNLQRIQKFCGIAGCNRCEKRPFYI